MSGSAVKAGRAFVEVFLKDKLSASLRGMVVRLRSMSRLIGGIGGAALTAGVGLVAPFLAAAKSFASTGDAIHKMSQRTGISAEALSELGFAAEQSGSSLGSLERGVRGMQRSILDLELGLSTSKDAFGELGLSLDDVAGRSPDDQFLAIAGALEQIEDPTRRAALAMKVFGRAGTELLPLIGQGAAGIEELTQQARDLGLTIDGQTAAAAAQLTDSFNALWLATKAGVFQIGGALAPVLIDLADRATAVSAAVGKWIREHRSVALVVGGSVAALIAAGGALVVLSGAVWALSLPLAGLAAAIGFLAPVIAAIASPIGLVVLGIGGAIAAFVAWRGSASAALESIKAGFGTVVGMVGSVAASIGDTLSAAAGSALQFVGRIPSMARDSLGAVPSVFESAFGSLRSIVGKAVGAIPDAFNSLLSSVGGVASSLADLLPSPFRAFVDAAGNVISQTVSLFRGFARLVGAALAPIRAIAQVAFAVIKPIAVGAFTAIGRTIRTVAGVAAFVASSIIKSFASMLSVGGQIFGSLVRTATGAFSSILQLGSRIGGAILGPFSGLSSALGRLFGSAAEIVGLFVSGAIEKVAQFGSNVLQFIAAPVSIIKQAWSSLAEVIGSPWERMIKVLEFAKSATQTGFAAMIGFAQGWWGAATGIFKGLATGAFNAFGAIKSSFLDFAGGISQWFGSIVSEAKIAWEGISAAIAVNDLKSAWSIAWNTMKLVALKTLGPLQLAWNEFTTGLTSMFDGAIVGIRQAWNSASTFIAQTMFSVLDKIKAAIDAVLQKMESLDWTGVVGKLSAALDFDTEGINQLLEDDKARFNANLDKNKQQRDDDRGAELAKRQAALAKATAEAEAEIRKVRDSAVALAEDVAAQAAHDELFGTDEDDKNLLKDAEDGLAEVDGTTSGVSSVDRSGTSSAAVASLFANGFGGGVQDRIAAAAEKTADNTLATKEELQELFLSWMS